MKYAVLLYGFIPFGASVGYLVSDAVFGAVVGMLYFLLAHPRAGKE